MCVGSVLHRLVVLQSPYDIIMTLLASVGPVIRARQQPAPGGKLGDSSPYSPKMLRNSAFPATTLGKAHPHPDPCARTLQSSLLRGLTAPDLTFPLLLLVRPPLSLPLVALARPGGATGRRGREHHPGGHRRFRGEAAGVVEGGGHRSGGERQGDRGEQGLSGLRRA